MFKYIIKKLKENRGDLGGLFGGKNQNQVSGIQIPTFQTDPNFTNSQNSLATLGQQVLSGNLPSFYSSLGKANSPEFQGALTNIEGQTNKNSQAAEAASGTARSGVGEAASALALNNVIPGLTYQDFLNSQQQQQGLLSFGAGVENDVAGNALNNQSQENSFSQQNFQDQFAQAQYNNSYNQMKDQQEGAFWGNIGSALFGQNVGSVLGSSMGYNGSISQPNQNNGMVGSFSNFLSSMNGANNNSWSAGNGLVSNMGAVGANGVNPYSTSSIDSLLSSNPSSLAFAFGG